MEKELISWIKYIFGYLLFAGWREIGYNFRLWSILMTDTYDEIPLFDEEKSYDYFWSSLNYDEILPKEFLESLYQMMDDVESGKIQTYPLTTDEFNSLQELVGHIDVNLNEVLKNEDAE